MEVQSIVKLAQPLILIFLQFSIIIFQFVGGLFKIMNLGILILYSISKDKKLSCDFCLI